MPKVKPAPTVKPQPTKVIEKHVEVIEPKKPILFRLFECVCWAEHALDNLNRIGIFPQGNTELMEKHRVAKQAATDLVKMYRDLWAAEQLKGGKS